MRKELEIKLSTDDELTITPVDLVQLLVTDMLNIITKKNGIKGIKDILSMNSYALMDNIHNRINLFTSYAIDDKGCVRKHIEYDDGMYKLYTDIYNSDCKNCIDTGVIGIQKGIVTDIAYDIYGYVLTCYNMFTVYEVEEILCKSMLDIDISEMEREYNKYKKLISVGVLE